MSDASLVQYRRLLVRRAVLCVALLAAGLVAVVADLAIGSGALPWRDVVAALLHRSTADPVAATIVWNVRMPITFTAALAGMGLAISGSLMQTILHNPLAEPFTLGISAAAGFGAALAIVFQASLVGLLPWLSFDLAVAANAFLFSLLAVGFVAAAAARRGLRTETVTLLGIAIHFVFSALLATIQYAADANQLQGLVFWMLGSLVRTTWTKLWLNAGILALLLPLLLLNTWAMTAVRAFGDGATVMGVRVARLRLLLLLAAALLAGGITATIGIVGFVGLVAPHAARLLVGEDQRFALPVTAALGLVVMTLASLVSKLVIPGVVLPIGMVTALLGLPFFIVQVLRQDARQP